MANVSEETKPLSLSDAQKLGQVLQDDNPTWNVSFGLAPSFDPKETDPSKQPYQIDTWFHIRTGSAYDAIVRTKETIQTKAKAVLGHGLNDDAISVRPIQVPDVGRAGTLGTRR